MKTLLRPLILLALIYGLHSCAIEGPKAISTSKPVNNTSYNVSFLFEYDGCKVHRFLDNGYYVYFTNCTGEITAISTDSTGKRTTNIINNSITSHGTMNAKTP